MNSIITLVQYVGKGKTFVIPNYQRGYIWGKKRIGGKNAVESLLDDLILHYYNRMEVFLQGFTVNETHNDIILIDGQQRTTFLFFLLKIIGYKSFLKISYNIREESNAFIADSNLWLGKSVTEDIADGFQDIYFFKKTIRIIEEKTRNIDNEPFLEFLLCHVKFLYINIDAKEATKIFKMMNGSRAIMKEEEIIKAEILRLASLSDDQQNISQEWESNQLRSRYAREWDKWLHWWNRNDVQSVFGCSNPMGLLVSSYSNLRSRESLSFEGFKNSFLHEGRPIEAKLAFDGLRRLQKGFEDSFNCPETRNRIGAILSIFSWDNKEKFIKYYFVEENRNKDELRRYYKAVFIGMTHDEIVSTDKKAFETKYDSALKSINDDFLYKNDPEYAFRLLLRLNVDQDIEQSRLFNFDIWGGGKRSLEHIYPKSKVGHIVEGIWYDGNDSAYKERKQEYQESDFQLTRQQICTTLEGNTIETSEHGIGNLVLLYKNENSKFNDADFKKKKLLFFSPNATELVRSRHLLHTICVFAEKENWDGAAIAMNKYDTINRFKNDYQELREQYDYAKQD